MALLTLATQGIAMARRPLPPQAYLLECFDYDADTGVLSWRSRPRDHFATTNRWAIWNSIYAGHTAGATRNKRGTRSVSIGRANFMLHRVIWKWVTGDEPPAHIDHREVTPADNRWQNIRDATASQNQWNRPKPKTNTSGFKGVSWHKKYGRWIASIRVHGCLHYLGAFANPEEAHAAYCEAAARLHGEFARTS